MYKDLHSPTGHQIAMYHGITREHALIVQGLPYEKDGTKRFPQEWVYKYVFAKGGNKSGKTHTDVCRELASKIAYPGHVSLIVRKRKEQLRNTYFQDFLNIVDKVTGGNRDWLILDEQEIDGSIELTIRSVGKPSKAIYRIEPDGAMQFSADSFKGYHLNSFTAEEASQLRWETINKCQINLDQDNYPSRGTIITNPTLDSTFIAKKFAKYMRELNNGQRPEMFPIVVDMRENTHLPPNYVETIKKQFEDDPIGLEMVMNGRDGVVRDGVPVFQGFFKHDVHVDEAIRFDLELPLVRAADFGHDVAACGFWQKTKSGRVYKIAELICEGMHVEQFADEVADYTRTHFPFIPGGIEDYGDHAGLQEKDTGQSIRIYQKRLGIHVRTTPFGNIDPGLNHMRKLLSELRDNKPRITYHPRCEQTILAMKFGYKYKEQRDGRVMQKPFKDGWFEHPVDSDRYGICHMIPLGREEKEFKNIRAKGIVDIRMQRAEKTLEEWLKQLPNGNAAEKK